MTTNASGKLNIGGVSAIKSIVEIPSKERTEHQKQYLDACLTALAHQPIRWLSYQDWGEGGPTSFFAQKGIDFFPVSNPRPKRKSWYGGCNCPNRHWLERNLE